MRWWKIDKFMNRASVELSNEFIAAARPHVRRYLWIFISGVIVYLVYIAAFLEVYLKELKEDLRPR